jgi:hypothetical protein
MFSKIIQKQSITYPGSKTPAIVRYSLFGLIDRIAINVIHATEEYIQNSGDEIAYHSHRENFVAIVLWGSYKDTRLIDGQGVVRILKPFSINIMKHTDLHNLEVLTPKVYTLFFRSKPRRKFATWYTKKTGEIHEIKYWMLKGFDTKKLRKMFNEMSNN